MNYKLPLEMKIHWAESAQDIEREWAEHVFWHSTEDRPGFTSSYRWSHSPECCATHTFGTLVGYDSCEKEWRSGIYEGYDEDYDERIPLYPEMSKYDRGLGMCVHGICSGVIEIADDGLSARSSFITPGVAGNPSDETGHKHYSMMWERYGQDWIFEDGDFKTGEFRILHNRVGYDFAFTYDGKNCAEEAYRSLMDSGMILVGMLSQTSPRNIDIPGPTHLRMSAVQVPQKDPDCPKPFACWAESETYIPAPGDNIKFRKVFTKKNED